MRSQQTLIFETWRLAGRLANHFEGVRRDFALNQTQILVLLALRRPAHVAPRKITPTDLSREVGLSRSTVSMQMTRLIERGLVVGSDLLHARGARLAKPDRRTHLYQLTSKGHDVATVLSDFVDDLSAHLVTVLSAKSYRATVAALISASEALESVPHASSKSSRK